MLEFMTMEQTRSRLENAMFFSLGRKFAGLLRQHVSLNAHEKDRKSLEEDRPGSHFILNVALPGRLVAVDPVYLFGFKESEFETLLEYTLERFDSKYASGGDRYHNDRKALKTARFGVMYGSGRHQVYESREDEVFSRLLGMPTLADIQNSDKMAGVSKVNTYPPSTFRAASDDPVLPKALDVLDKMNLQVTRMTQIDDEVLVDVDYKAVEARLLKSMNERDQITYYPQT